MLDPTACKATGVVKGHAEMSQDVEKENPSPITGEGFSLDAYSAM